MAPKEERMLSFGIEMEFYIFWCAEGEEVTSRPPGFQSHPGRPITGERPDVLDTLALSINNLLADARSATVWKPGELIPLGAFSTWGVHFDISLSSLPEDLEEVTDEHSGWVGVEVVSPALWSTKEAFDQVRRVCEYLQSTYWISTPTNCGFHVHVGQGPNWLPVNALRQIAAFLYAADPVLAQSYPEHRRVDTLYCPSLRLYSNITLGLRIGNFGEHESEVENMDNISIVTGLRGTGEGFLSSIFGLFRTKKEETRIEDNFPPRPTTPSYVTDSGFIEELLAYNERTYGITKRTADYSPTPILEAVAEILRATSREVVGQLVRTRRRSNYSFLDLVLERKRTIEFRQAAATVDPAEVVSRTRVAVSLCEFAANATEEQFQKLFFDLASAETDPRWIDIYDLLAELDLRPEARVIHAALTGRLDQSVRDAYFEERQAD
ncbi:hypothetical protein F4805DRAFT_473846 [Annulohypoxylon moriforme]|nr:hypothetical protein F4805DRAFT_473846 [Annulohypoxylon moriforme]